MLRQNLICEKLHHTNYFQASKLYMYTCIGWQQRKKTIIIIKSNEQ